MCNMTLCGHSLETGILEISNIVEDFYRKSVGDPERKSLSARPCTFLTYLLNEARRLSSWPLYSH